MIQTIMGDKRLSARWLRVLAGLAGLALVACAPGASPGGGAGGPVPDELIVGLGDDVTYFSSVRTFGGNASYLTRNVYESLVNLNTGGNVIPGVASSWKVTPDGKQYEFKLRKGATYTNGDPVTVQDVAFVFANSKDPKFVPNQAPQRHWKGLEVVDDETVRYVLDFPDPGFLKSLAGSYPHHLVSKKYYDSIGGEEAFEKAPVGLGPYKVVDRKVKEGWILERYEGYWGEKPQVRKATFKVIPEPSTRAAAMRVGEIDFAANFPPSFMDDLERAGGHKLIKNPAGNTITIRINKLRDTDPSTGKTNPFLDKRVRQAMSYSIDRDAIISKILNGVGEKIAMLFPDDFGYDPELKPYPYDPSKAKQLLAEAGFPNGFDTTFYGLLGERIPLSKEVGEAIAQYMTAVGIRTKVVNEEYAAWLARTQRSTSWDKPNELYPMGYGMTWVGGQTSPWLGWRINACDNTSHGWVCDPEFDKQIEQLRLEGDAKKAEALVKAMARKVHDEQWTVVLYRNVVVYAMKDRVEFTPTAQSQYVELRNLRWK
ncbi:MAG: ABC transporter substrate-binding protein [Chloroflexi bacterium]|nr:ABC transporter substrate-binding protein [Chloroflexota bacterium]